jgi:type I restriction enzyme S subunit
LIGSVALPLGWVWVRIDEVSNVGTGATPLKGNPKYYESGAVSWVTSGLLNELFITKVEEKITELAVKETNAKVFPKHTLLVAMYGEGKTRGKVSELLVEAATNQACAALVFGGEASKLRPFVKLFLQKNYNDIRRLSSGGVQPNLNLGIIKATKVPIPPLNEQRRIVAKIEALKARSQRVKEELEAIAPLLDQFRQSVLAAAFRGDLTADWREKNPDVEPASVLLERIRAERRHRWEEAELEKMKAQGKTPKDDKWKEKYEEPTADTSDLPAIPKSWTWATLPEIGELNRGKSKHRPRNDPALFGGSYPFIQTGEIRSANGVISNFSQTYSELGLKQSRLWSKGTLCITIAANIAETAILGLPACFPDSVVGFLPETSGCDVRFVEFFMRIAKNDLERFAPATAQKNINLEILRVVAIPFSPLEEQQKIIAAIERYFSVAEAIERMLSENSEQIQHLEQSILAKAFRGELVPQDPKDEPASVLLERIRAEREKLDTKKKAKGKTEKKSRKTKSEAAEPEQLSLPGFE